MFKDRAVVRLAIEKNPKIYFQYDSYIYYLFKKSLTRQSIIENISYSIRFIIVVINISIDIHILSEYFSFKPAFTLA